MGVRLSDTATVLVPATAADEFTGQPLAIDWEQDPTQVATAFHGEPMLVRSQNLDEETTLAKWRGFLPPDMAGTVTPACRISWHGVTYSIDGAIGEHRKRGRIRYLSVILKLVGS